VGAIFGGLFMEVDVLQVVLLMFWFMLPGALFFNAINDVYDWETDKLNPRKQGVEMASDESDQKKLFITAAISLFSAVVFLPFVSGSFLFVFCVWSVMIGVYNIPPLRFKARPILNVLFGGVAHYVPIAVMGFVFTSGNFPSVEYIILGILFMAAGHLAAGDAMDIPYDKQAGIQTLGVVIGSGRSTLALACVLYLLIILLCVTQSLAIAGLLIIPFPVYLLYEMHLNNITHRSVTIYRNFNYLCIYFWITLVSIYLHLSYSVLIF